MTAPAEPYASTERRTLDTSAFRRQGALAGVFGASLLAAWFLYLDALRGKPFFTPTPPAPAPAPSGGLPSPRFFSPPPPGNKSRSLPPLSWPRRSCEGRERTPPRRWS